MGITSKLNNMTAGGGSGITGGASFGETFGQIAAGLGSLANAGANVFGSVTAARAANRSAERGFLTAQDVASIVRGTQLEAAAPARPAPARTDGRSDLMLGLAVFGAAASVVGLILALR